MSYLDLLKLAAPEAIVTLTALVVLVIGVTTSRGTAVAGVSPAMPRRAAAGTAASTAFCTLVAALGLVIAIEAILMLPAHANLFHGMLVTSPLNSFFQIVCLVLAFLPSFSRPARHQTTASILPSFCSLLSACYFSLAARSYS